jgi:ABC-type oligopeptide transport system ATPase subunit
MEKSEQVPGGGEILLAGKGLCKGFPGVWQHLILDHIDIDIRAGEIHTLLGENGAGKTVIANCLSGFYSLSEGQIYVKGHRNGSPGIGAGETLYGGAKYCVGPALLRSLFSPA